MTAKIFSKDLRLAAHPMMYVFALFGVMLIIPNYPYTVVFFYGLLGIFFTFLYNFFAAVLRSVGNSFVPLLFLLLSGLFAVTVATYGVERELYLPVELFHPLFVP